MWTRRVTFAAPLLAAVAGCAAPPAGADLPRVAGVEFQPVAAQVRRLLEALEIVGAPLPAADRAALERALQEPDAARALARVQEILDPHCIAGVTIAAPEGPTPVGRIEIGPWKFIGPFDNAGGKGMDKVYPPEQEIDLAAAYDGVEGKRVTWQDGSQFKDGQAGDLFELFERRSHILCYLTRTIEAERDLPARLLLGSDDTLTVWLNGEKVHEHRQARALQVDEDEVAIRLKKGANRLLLKVGNLQGGYGFSFQASLRLPEHLLQEVAAGPAPAELVQQGWRAFLVKVHNAAGVTASLTAGSPNTGVVYKQSRGSAEPSGAVTPEEIQSRWLELDMFSARPFQPELSGLSLEYRILQLFSRDAGDRQARIAFTVGRDSREIDTRFACRPATAVKLRVRDVTGEPATASFLVKDGRGRVYPSQTKRLAPDFFFHPQVYRADGETLSLPPGEYDVEYTRGPEYKTLRRRIAVPRAASHEESFQLERWTDPAARGWISGDHHIHAAGCAHYEKPTEGVMPADMMRHILGEDLKVGCVLTWGPCYYFQKRFFTGGVDKLSTDRYLMRYDLEVSGFPSSHAGHIVLLNLKEQDYPGTKRIEDWPSWDLPLFRWAKAQGAVTGFAHSGWGLKVDGDELPNPQIPPYDGIGANEYIMDVTHEVPGPDGKPVPAVDFISLVDTPVIWELSIWYHTLNAGFRARGSGETDFPCIYGDRVGLGRIYVKVPPGKLGFDAWIQGVRDGRSYVGDGRSHLVDFTVNGAEVGVGGSEVKLDAPGKVTARARVAALLDETDRPGIRKRPLDRKPYWDIERARIEGTRQVPVELIVNGKVAAKQVIDADGTEREMTFEAEIAKSGWVALRIFPSSHTNPVFVTVGGKPIRVKESLDWCLQGVEQCWRQKERSTRKGDEREAAQKAYEHAREVYRARLKECE